MKGKFGFLSGSSPTSRFIICLLVLFFIGQAVIIHARVRSMDRVIEKNLQASGHLTVLSQNSNNQTTLYNAATTSELLSILTKTESKPEVESINSELEKRILNEDDVRLLVEIDSVSNSAEKRRIYWTLLWQSKSPAAMKHLEHLLTSELPEALQLVCLQALSGADTAHYKILSAVYQNTFSDVVRGSIFSLAKKRHNIHDPQGLGALLLKSIAERSPITEDRLQALDLLAVSYHHREFVKRQGKLLMAELPENEQRKAFESGFQRAFGADRLEIPLKAGVNEEAALRALELFEESLEKHPPRHSWVWGAHPALVHLEQAAKNHESERVRARCLEVIDQFRTMAIEQRMASYTSSVARGKSSALRQKETNRSHLIVPHGLREGEIEREISYITKSFDHFPEEHEVRKQMERLRLAALRDVGFTSESN